MPFHLVEMDKKNYVVSCFHVLSTAIVITVLNSLFPSFTFYYSKLANLTLYVLFAFVTYSLSKRRFCRDKIQTKNKAVLITGCDSGFGNALAKRMDSKGFKVFASCMFPEGPGAVDLKKTCSDNLQVLYLDVTKDDSVEKAANFVKSNLGTSDLWALVNNAGIYKGFFTEFTPTDVFREVLEVNSIGPVRVTKAFLPLLRKSKGRVVNVTSTAGRLTPIFMCGYAMSKHAAVAFTECLSQEMKTWGIRVISIEPELFNTSLVDRSKLIALVKEEFKSTSEEILKVYGEEFKQKLEQLILLVPKIFGSPKIKNVVDAMEAAITDKYPEYVYKVRHSIFTRFFWWLAEIIPFGLFAIGTGFIFRIAGYPTPKHAKKCN